GISGKVGEEIKLEECRSQSIPILRRRSGGGTVLIGPGCLNYSLILSFENWPHYRDLTHSYRGILNRIGRTLGDECQLAGPSDLIFDSFKFSGNAQRRLKNAFIHHGTLLYDFDLEKVSQFLKEPPKQPAYRQRRPHSAFIKNLPLTMDTMKNKLCRAFEAERNWKDSLPDFRAQLTETYLNPDWNLRC
ncbi:MAG: lipoate--protein ligase family protein, partial [Planctomycetota bacterium]|nr:lipoate--protein ligase family protein [Planctomycetota bacterium]